MPSTTALDKLISDLNARMIPDGAAKSVITRGPDIDPVRMIPASSYAINHLLGGGWPEGKLIEFFGPEHASKSTLMLLALNDIYRFHDGSKHVAYIDVEHRFNSRWANSLGLELSDKFVLVQPPNAEDGTDAMAEFIRSKQFCAIGWDSIGGASSWKDQQTFQDRDGQYKAIAGVMTRNVQTIAPLANLYDVTCFYANQLRADMEGYNRPMTPGGKAVKHEMSVRIYIRRGKEKYMDKSPQGDVEVGFACIFKAIKNSYGPAPREQWTDFYFVPCRYLDHVGYDVQKELQRLGLLTGTITQRGSWYEFGTVRANGREAFFTALQEAGQADALSAAVMSALDTGVVGESVELDRSLSRPDAEGPEIDSPEV